MSLAQLSIDLTAKIASFEAELKRSTRIAEEQSAKMKSALGLASGALKGLAAGLSIGAFASYIKGAADVADEMSKMSRRAGVTTEAMSELAYAASLADVDNQELAKAIRLLGNDAAAGGEKLSKLGIGLADSAGKARTSDQLFREVAQRIAGIEDPAKRAAVASELFGDKLGPQLIPLLEGGRAALEKAADEASRFGKVITTEAGVAAEQFNDNLTRLEARARGLAITLAGPVINGLNGLFGAFDRAQQRKSVAGLATDVIKLNNDLKALEARRDNPFINQKTLEENIRQTKEKLDAAKSVFLKAKQDFDNPTAGAAAPVFTPSAAALGVKPAKGASGAGREKVSEAERYLQSLQRQLEATQNLTVEEALLRDIQLGRLGKVSESAKADLVNVARQIDQVREQAKADEERWEIIRMRRQVVIDEAEAVERANNEYQNLVQSLLDATPTARLEEQRRVMQVLADEFERGRINAQQFSEAAQTYLGNVPEQTKKANDLVKDLGLSFTSAFEDAVVGGKKFSEVLKGLEADIIRIVTRKLVTEPLGNAVSGFLGGINWGSLLSFDGGGYTGSGSRSGGLDGKGGYLAMLHPRETVIDHTKGQGVAPARVQNINITVPMPSSGRRETAMQFGADVARQLRVAGMRNG